MTELHETTTFRIWLRELRDVSARLRIAARLRCVELGNLGDTKSVGDGVQELRIDYGPGYRLYFVRRGSAIIVLLCGGDKNSQQADIRRAKVLAKEV